MAFYLAVSAQIKAGDTSAGCSKNQGTFKKEKYQVIPMADFCHFIEPKRTMF
jgi:hypothetical protein